MARFVNRPALLVCAAALALAPAACGDGDAPTPPASPVTGSTPAAAGASTPAGGTFGTQPCGKLVSFEEIASAVGARPAIVDIVAEGQCNYEDGAGTGLLEVVRASTPAGPTPCAAPDGSTGEVVSGIGDTASWSPATMTICFARGADLVRITLGTRLADPKAAATVLATAAARRV